MTLTREQVARMVDHTLLKPETTDAQVQALAVEAGELGAYSICVSPNRLPVSVPDGVLIATVCGFPSGAHHGEIKAAEAARAVRDGAHEVDMVVALSLVMAGDWAGVQADITAVRTACPVPVALKVIIESAALNEAQIVACCQAAERAGADFVKTSTGFHPAGGASVEAVALMARTVGGRLGVKASGGIRSAEAALAMIEAGATRLGLSGTRAVLDGLSGDGSAGGAMNGADATGGSGAGAGVGAGAGSGRAAARQHTASGESTTHGEHAVSEGRSDVGDY